MRGGITRAFCYCAETNHDHIYDYDEIKESSYMFYLDFNNQYGWATSTSIWWT